MTMVWTRLKRVMHPLVTIGLHLSIITTDKIDLNVIAVLVFITAGLELQTSGHHAVSRDCHGARC
jgi:hypothetical protein